MSGACRRSVLVFALLSSCSSKSHDAPAPSPEAAIECPFPGSIDGPRVSFEGELLPFFASSCAFVGCHDGTSRLGGLYLGPNFNEGAPGASVVAEIHDSLLAPSTAAAGVPRVAPGEPLRSFLMLKLDGCQNAVGLECPRGPVGQPCGARMPALSKPLSADRRDLVRRWIAQGAPGAGDAGQGR